MASAPLTPAATIARLRRLGDIHEQAAAQMRSVATLIDRDPDSPDVRRAVDDLVHQYPALAEDGAR